MIFETLGLELSNFIYLEAPDSDAMARARLKHFHVDYVFVDTPGLSSGRTLLKHGLEKWAWIPRIPRHKSQWLHFATLFRRRNFTPLQNLRARGGIVWTKLDEAASFGNIVNVANESCLPVSALSYGPELKESLEPATEPLVWRLIFKRQLPGPGPEATRNQVKV